MKLFLFILKLPPYNNQQKMMPPDNEAYGNAPPLPSKTHQANQFDQDENFGSRPPSYNLSDNNTVNSVNEKKQPMNSAPTDYDDDLGLPSVPDSYPNDYFKGGNGGGHPAPSTSNSNQNDQSASIDYDELTKRFNNLKSFK